MTLRTSEVSRFNNDSRGNNKFQIQCLYLGYSDCVLGGASRSIVDLELLNQIIISRSNILASDTIYVYSFTKFFYKYKPINLWEYFFERHKFV